MEKSQVFDLDAMYFRYREFVLAAHHITLTAAPADDAGWHLKLLVSHDERSELHDRSGPIRNRYLGDCASRWPVIVRAPTRANWCSSAPPHTVPGSAQTAR
jgi:hypothetical protein